MNYNKQIYFMGGSPCSGKSTVAEYLSNQYNLYYFKVDDFLDQYTEMGYEKNKPICKKQCEWSLDAIWSRVPKLQCEEEFMFYDEIFAFMMEDLKKIEADRIIAEGVAFYPNQIKKMNIASNHYITMVPTKAFQVAHYQQREWIHELLKECKNPTQAFENWMERDHLFAKEVEREAHQLGYQTIINDGTLSIDELIEKVCKHFGWEDEYV